MLRCHNSLACAFMYVNISYTHIGINLKLLYMLCDIKIKGIKKKKYDWSIELIAQ